MISCRQRWRAEKGKTIVVFLVVPLPLPADPCVYVHRIITIRNPIIVLVLGKIQHANMYVSYVQRAGSCVPNGRSQRLSQGRHAEDMNCIVETHRHQRLRRTPDRLLCSPWQCDSSASNKQLAATDSVIPAGIGYQVQCLYKVQL